MGMTAATAPGADGQAAVLAFLASGHAFGGGPPTRIDTHAAHIFLAGEQAWKLKRAVKYPYLDFSTPDLRHAALQSELELNRRTAPDLYRGVWPVTRDCKGAFHVAGAGETVDWLLEMQRFPQSALLSQMADGGGLDDALLIRLAERLVAFHAIAAPCAADRGSDRLREVIRGNRDSLSLYPAICVPGQVSALIDNQLRRIEANAPLLDRRGKAGRIRHCHGDLHLANIAMIEDEPTLFDCLEFDSELAQIDVLYDLSFLLMDLWQHGLHRAANLVFNRYFDLSPADEEAVGLMPLLMSIRATIRAHVLAAAAAGKAEDDAARAAKAYLALAGRLLEPVEPLLLAVGGLSGTGKSSLARGIAAEIGAPPGARLIRTDVVRKRIAGLAPEVALPRASYTPAASRKTYAAAFGLAARTITQGASVVIDAVFGDQKERAAIQRVATAKARVLGLWLTASRARRLERVAGRGKDASDADQRVAAAQIEPASTALSGWRRVSADGSQAETLAVARAALGSDLIRDPS